MTIREFQVGCSKTVNQGNFNSIRVEASLTVTVQEGDDVAVLKRLALTDLNALLEDSYRALLKRKEPANE